MTFPLARIATDGALFAATVIAAVTNLIEVKGARKAYTFEEETGAVYLTINAILDELKLCDTPMTYGKVSQIIRNITEDVRDRIARETIKAITEGSKMALDRPCAMRYLPPSG